MTVNNKGFTLMEIMVSLAVLAIVLTSLFRLQSSTVNLSEAARFKSLAPVAAQQALSDLARSGFDPDGISSEFEDEIKGYTVSCEVIPAEDSGGWEDWFSEKGAASLKKIRLTVHDPGRNRSFTLVTWRYAHDEDD